jgi:hypothetical protein
MYVGRHVILHTWRKCENVTMRMLLCIGDESLGTMTALRRWNWGRDHSIKFPGLVIFRPVINKHYIRELFSCGIVTCHLTKGFATVPSTKSSFPKHWVSFLTNYKCCKFKRQVLSRWYKNTYCTFFQQNVRSSVDLIQFNLYIENGSQFFIPNKIIGFIGHLSVWSHFLLDCNIHKRFY